MPTVSDVASLIRKEELTKRRLYARSSRLVNIFAFDNVEEMSAKELAKKVLQKLGLKHETDDPVKALESYLDGHDAGERARGGAERVWPGSGIDSAEGGSLVNDYINGK